MSKARLVITAVIVEGRSQGEAARAYGVSQGWVSRLVARYRAEGEAAFEPRSRRPKTSPTATSASTVELIIQLRKRLSEQGLDAGPDTIAWHLRHHHQLAVSRATISRYRTAHGLVTPQPKKRPRSSYVRFQAALPNQTWQADFTHYRLADATDAEVLTWLDDHSRYALHVSAHAPVTGPVVLAAFRAAVAAHRLAPLLATNRDHDTHTRIRHDRIDDSGVVTLRVAGHLHHVGIGRTHARTHVIMLVDDLHVRVVNAATGELLRELTIDPSRDYQPTGRPPGPQRQRP
jgi:transposase InsO family protein